MSIAILYDEMSLNIVHSRILMNIGKNWAECQVLFVLRSYMPILWAKYDCDPHYKYKKYLPKQTQLESSRAWIRIQSPLTYPLDYHTSKFFKDPNFWRLGRWEEEKYVIISIQNS